MSMSGIPRLFYNYDGAFLQYVKPPITSERLLHETVGRLSGTQVDAIVCHMFSAGDSVPLYRTNLAAAELAPPARASSVNVWKYARNLVALKAMDPDPWV